MKDNTITISREELLDKFMEVTANYATNHPEIGVVFTMTSILVCHLVTDALFGEEDT